MEEYLLVYVLFSGMERERRYVSYMAEALSGAYDDLVYVTCRIEDDLEEAVRRAWGQAPARAYRGLICVTGRLFGPFWDIQKDLAAFDAGGEEAMAYQDPEDGLPGFFVVKREACIRGQLWRGVHSKRIVCGRTGTHAIREDLARPYTSLCRGYPFLDMECFAATDHLRYTMGEELARVMDYLRREAGYDTGMIWEVVLERYDLYDIKRALHLDWIIQEREEDIRTEKKAAVFLHLFYEDSLDRVIGYIERIPPGIDIYVSTHPGQVAGFSKKLEENNIPVVKVLGAGVRGRDAGALLVAFRPYLMQYGYICFLHDKRSSGGLEPEAVGDSFMELMWESLLKDRGHINRILALFEEDEKLGFLSPPVPVMGRYTTILGAEWTICFEETKKLAHKLGCKIKVDRDKPVFALSTSFWCRTRALEPLFTYPWEYGDFPEEPLRLDGTINHAIERILIYIAQEKGYYPATVTTAEYASIYMEDLLYMLESILGELHRGDWLDIKFPLRLDQMIEELCRLAVFCRGHRRLYVYGAGAQAEMLFHRLHALQIDVCCVVVTRGQEREQILGHPVRVFSEVEDLLDEDCGVILAMSRKYQEEVIDAVKRTGADIFRIMAKE